MMDQKTLYLTVFLLLSFGNAKSLDYLNYILFDSTTVRVILEQDFESGTLSPWYDESSGAVYWHIEDHISPAEPNLPAPSQTSGKKYLRATRNPEQLESGLVIFRSPKFTAAPGDRVTFDFWIRSRRTQGNTLDVNKFILLEILNNSVIFRMSLTR